MRNLYLGVMAAFGSAATPVAANETGAATRAAADRAQLVCRSFNKTGSMFSAKKCRTAEEWAVLDRRNGKRAVQKQDDRQGQTTR